MLSLPPLQSFMYFSNGQSSIKTHASCKEIFEEKFRESICRAFKLHSSRGQESLGMHLVLGRDGWMREKKEISSAASPCGKARLARGWEGMAWMG